MWIALCGPCLEVNSARDGAVLVHDPQLFSTPSMQRLAATYVAAVRMVVEQPEVTVGQARRALFAADVAADEHSAAVG